MNSSKQFPYGSIKERKRTDRATRLLVPGPTVHSVGLFLAGGPVWQENFIEILGKIGYIETAPFGALHFI